MGASTRHPNRVRRQLLTKSFLHWTRYAERVGNDGGNLLSRDGSLLVDGVIVGLDLERARRRDVGAARQAVRNERRRGGLAKKHEPEVERNADRNAHRRGFVGGEPDAVPR